MKFAFLNTTINPFPSKTPIVHHWEATPGSIAHEIGDSEIKSFVGHESTVRAWQTLLKPSMYGREKEIVLNREPYDPEPGDIAFALKMKGRPPEGVIMDYHTLLEVGFDLYRVQYLDRSPTPEPDPVASRAFREIISKGAPPSKAFEAAGEDFKKSHPLGHLRDEDWTADQLYNEGFGVPFRNGAAYDRKAQPFQALTPRSMETYVRASILNPTQEKVFNHLTKSLTAEHAYKIAKEI